MFTRKTFQYFDQAENHKAKREWFAKNKTLYDDNVREPFAAFLGELSHRLHNRLPDFSMHPRKILRPLRSERKAETRGHVRAISMVFLQEKQTSHFERNPGFYLHLGAGKEDNEIGMGLSQPTSRQLKRLREAIVADKGELSRILADKKLKKLWGGIGGDRYRRFPRACEPGCNNEEYLWYKQFMLIRNFTRAEVTKKDFPDTVLRSFEAGLPFFEWVREAVGLFDWAEWKRAKKENGTWVEERFREV
jgi:uncharacterized protein (TIGR02453 family)